VPATVRVFILEPAAKVIFSDISGFVGIGPGWEVSLPATIVFSARIIIGEIL
jgi:hypothetical protein